MVPTSEDLRLGSVSNNQDLLVQGFLKATSHINGPIIFDGHLIIDGKDGLITIPTWVFTALGLSSIVVLQAPATQIAYQRASDTRVRPVRTIAEISDHQTMTISAATNLAAELSIPMHIIGSGDTFVIEALIRRDPTPAN